MAGVHAWPLRKGSHPCLFSPLFAPLPPQVAKASGKHVNSLRDAVAKFNISTFQEKRPEVLRLFKAASDAVHERTPSLSLISTFMAARLLRKMKCTSVSGFFGSLNKEEPPTAYHQPGAERDTYLDEQEMDEDKRDELALVSMVSWGTADIISPLGTGQAPQGMLILAATPLGKGQAPQGMLPFGCYSVGDRACSAGH